MKTAKEIAKTLKKSELIEWIQLSEHLYGSDYFFANKHNEYTIYYKDLTRWERLKIVWVVFKFFVLQK